MSESVIGKAKRSVDNTIDAYLGRAAFAASILAATVFALIGAWISLVDRLGTMQACFALALVLLAISAIIRVTIVLRERAAEEDLAEVEKTLETNGAPIAKLAGIAAPFDLATVLSFAPLVLPLVRSLRFALPIMFVVGLAAALVMTPSKTAEADSNQ